MSRLNEIVVTVLGHSTPQAQREALSSALAECLEAELVDLSAATTGQPAAGTGTLVQLGRHSIEVHPADAAGRLRAWPGLLTVVTLLVSDINDALESAEQ